MTITVAQAIQWQQQQEELEAHALVKLRESYLGRLQVIKVEIYDHDGSVSVMFTQDRAGVRCEENKDFKFEEFFQEED